MSAQKGSAFLLKVGDGATPVVYTTVAGLRSVSVSAAGIFTGSVAELRVKASALAGVIDDYRLAFEGGEMLTGRFLVTRLDYAGDHNGERSYTVNLESSGPVMAA